METPPSVPRTRTKNCRRSPSSKPLKIRISSESLGPALSNSGPKANVTRSNGLHEGKYGSGTPSDATFVTFRIHTWRWSEPKGRRSR